MVNAILESRPAHFQLFDFLVGREIDFLLDAINFVIKPMIFIEDAPEMVTRALEAANDFTMFRKLSED